MKDIEREKWKQAVRELVNENNRLKKLLIAASKRG